MLAALPPRTTLSGLASGPPLDLGTEPELDAALPEVEHGLGHVLIPLLVLVNRVAVSETEYLGHALRVDQVLRSDPWRHGPSLHR
jgi:hypothetical protein